MYITSSEILVDFRILPCMKWILCDYNLSYLWLNSGQAPTKYVEYFKLKEFGKIVETERSVTLTFLPSSLPPGYKLDSPQMRGSLSIPRGGSILISRDERLLRRFLTKRSLCCPQFTKFTTYSLIYWILFHVSVSFYHFLLEYCFKEHIQGVYRKEHYPGNQEN